MKSERRVHDLEIERARAKDTQSIWRIIRASFTDPISRYTAIGQAGYGEFLHDLLSHETSGEKFIVIGRVKGEVVAFADITLGRATPNFLTRIAVRPDFRGRGLAEQVLRKVHEAYGNSNTWELDVFATNSGAVRLYKSLGFKVVLEKRWICRMPLEIASPTEEYRSTLDPADSRYSRYGFTSLSIDGHSIAIAGMAARYPNLDSFSNDSIFAKVKDLYPAVDRTFIILNEPIAPEGLPEGSFEIAKNYRMLGTF